MEKALKQSNASLIGGTGGSLGGASTSDLERGFMSDEEPGESMAHERSETGEELMSEGFVGRPGGWER